MTEGWFFGGAVVVKELLDLGYKGSIYPIHPSADRVHGLHVYRSVEQTRGPVDLAVIATSFRAVPDILRSCALRGVKAAVIVADGFAESGPDGALRQEEVVSIARAAGIRIIGPNTLGIYSPHEGISTVPYEKGYGLPPRGGLSIVTQTGMYGPQATAFGEYRFGVRTVIDLGNMCDVDEVDCLGHLGEDPETRVIGLYLEHSRRPRSLLATARSVSGGKPVICLKGGRSRDAAGAMASHTGSVSSDDRLYDALFAQAGIVRVSDYEDVLDVAKAFLTQPLPPGNRLGIISLTGAIGIQCIDIAAEVGLVPGRLGGESVERLKAMSPTLAGNPVDLGPASAANGAELFSYYQRCFDVLSSDEAIDCIYMNTYISGYMVPEMYEGLFSHISSNLSKPVVMWSYGPSPEAVRGLGALAESHGIPFYTTTRKAVSTLGCLVKYAASRRRVGRHGDNPDSTPAATLRT